MENYMSDMVARLGDMHPNRGLRLFRQEDGDIIVVIEQNGCRVRGRSLDGREEVFAEVEFCTSGGRSPNTRRALAELMKAMELDNAETRISTKP